MSIHPWPTIVKNQTEVRSTFSSCPLKVEYFSSFMFSFGLFTLDVCLQCCAISFTSSNNGIHGVFFYFYGLPSTPPKVHTLLKTIVKRIYCSFHQTFSTVETILKLSSLLNYRIERYNKTSSVLS